MRRTRGEILTRSVVTFRSSPPFSGSTVSNFTMVTRGAFKTSRSTPGRFGVISTVNTKSFSSGAITRGRTVIVTAKTPVPDKTGTMLVGRCAAASKSSLAVCSRMAPNRGVDPGSRSVRGNRGMLSGGAFVECRRVNLVTSTNCSAIGMFGGPEIGVVVANGRLMRPAGRRVSGTGVVGSGRFAAGTVIRSSKTVTRVSRTKSAFSRIHRTVLRTSGRCSMVVAANKATVDGNSIILSTIRSLKRVLFRNITMEPNGPINTNIIGNGVMFALSKRPITSVDRFSVITEGCLFRVRKESFSFRVRGEISRLGVPSRLKEASFVHTITSSSRTGRMLGENSNVVESVIRTGDCVVVSRGSRKCRGRSVISMIFFSSLL